jgi:Spy/CpxP family protein refolding chaperone
MRNLKKLAMAFLLASLATTPAYAKTHGQASSCDRGDRGTKRLERLKQTLKLTTQQQTEIRAILAESRKGTADRAKAVQANRAAIRSTLAAAALDESRLRELLRRQSELQADRMVEKHARRARIKQALTVEQQAKWDELSRQRLGHRDRHATSGRKSEAGHAETAM